MRILFAGSQGGDLDIDLNCAAAAEWVSRAEAAKAVFAVWTYKEGERVHRRAPFAEKIHVYEDFLARGAEDWRLDVERLNRSYPKANWSAVIASERSFTDASFLIGAGGNRREDHDYAQRIIVNTVRFLETVFDSAAVDAVLCQTSDSLFNHVVHKVAEGRGVRILAVSPVWIAGSGQPGFSLACDEYTHSPALIEAYRELRGRELTQAEVERAEGFRRSMLGFEPIKVYASATGGRYISSALSPNIRRLPAYLLENYRRNKEVDYRRFDPLATTKANILRLWRRWRTRPLLGSKTMPSVQRFVLFAMHFQPEQSTLVGGIFHANQIALAESIAKSLPLGWMLVIKEHPKGRGSRPAWQYRHLTSYPNVIFSDAPTRELLGRAGAVVTITGTIAIEAMALDRPAVVLGQTYFDHAEVLYRPAGEEDLPRVLRHILVEGDYERRTDRHELIKKFFVSYVSGHRPGLPSRLENAPLVAEAIIEAMAPCSASEPQRDLAR